MLARWLIPKSKKASLAVIALFIAVTVGVFSLNTPEAVTSTVSTGLDESAQSSQVELLQDKATKDPVQPAIVVLSKEDGSAFNDTAKKELPITLRQAVPAAAQAAPLQFAGNNKVGYTFVPIDTSKGLEAVADEVAALREDLDTLPSDVKAEVTGGPAFTADLAQVFEGANVNLLLITVIVVAVLLIITYRSPVLWLIPLITVGVAEQLALRVVDFIAPGIDLPLDGAAKGIASVLAFGAGTNYALLLIARYKDELHNFENRFEAMAKAWSRTAEAILASGLTVVISLCVLLLASLDSTQAIGVASALSVLVAMVFSLVLLPAALVLFPRGIFWPVVPKYEGKAYKDNSVWQKIGNAVAKRPRAVLAGGMAVLVLMAASLPTLQVGLAQNDRFRIKPEAVLGQETLASALPAGASDPLTVLVATSKAEEAKAAILATPTVESVQPARAIDDRTNFSVILSASPETKESYQAVQDIRDRLAAIPESQGIVGGRVAQGYDTKLANDRDQALIAPIILVIVFIILIALLRSLVAPVLLLISVLLTYVASIGASWLFFKYIYGIPAFDTGVLLLSFLFLVALGVDYNIFLSTRAKEEAEQHGTKKGMLTALRVTGGVITSAGILLAAVFAVLGVLPLITLTQIGVIVGIGVLLDTLLVRTVLVPATAFILGDRFWWPNRMAKKNQ